MSNLEYSDKDHIATNLLNRPEKLNTATPEMVCTLARNAMEGVNMTEKRRIKTMEELKAWIGKEVAIGKWITITQDQINKFADVSGDHQWIHVDVERANRESPYKTTIAQGNLTVSLLTSMERNTDVELPPAKAHVNYGFNKIRFTGVVPVNSRVRGRFRLIEIKEVGPMTHMIVWGVTGELEGQAKPILIAEKIQRRTSA